MIHPFNSFQESPEGGEAEQLARLIRLAQKTGDTLIVTNSSEATPVAIVPIDRYEQLVTDDEFDPWVMDDDWFEDEMVEQEPPIMEVTHAEESVESPSPVRPVPEPQEPQEPPRYVDLPPEPNVPVEEVESVLEESVPEIKDASPKVVQEEKEMDTKKTRLNTKKIEPAEQELEGEEQFYLEPIE